MSRDFNDTLHRQGRANRPGRVPFIDTDSAPYFGTVTIDGAGAGSVFLPDPQRDYARKWLFLVAGASPATLAVNATITLNWRTANGRPLFIWNGKAIVNTAMPIIGGFYSNPGFGASGIAFRGLEPFIVQRPRDVVSIGGVQEGLLLAVSGQTALTDVMLDGRYIDIPL